MGRCSVESEAVINGWKASEESSVDATARVKRETKSDGPFAAGELISFSGSGDRPSPSGRWIPRPVNTQLSFSASSVALALSPFLEGAPLCSPGQPLSYTISLLSPVRMPSPPPSSIHTQGP